jgi:hypothetical protein
MKRTIVAALLFAAAFSAHGVIRRDPNGVNVNSMGATTVFITFGGLENQIPVEAFWCGELIPAAPDIGQKCRPDTIFGRLPLRYDLSRVQGPVFTDIMSIPSNVVRRAYDAAIAGQTSSFFYVRRFVRNGGGPDEYVFVTCRMAGVGARTPLALTDVRVQFETDTQVLPVRPGTTPSKLHADITYNGTGRLQGRWEVVLPGDDTPRPEDLLTEASLPVSLRGQQRRYTQIERFNIFLPPTGNVRLEGPDPSKLPTATEGLYQILLRVEASNDKESDSNLALAGAGSGVVHSGGVAGFPMPVLRYYVGNAGSTITPSELSLIAPLPGFVVVENAPLEFRWNERGGAPFHQLEIRDAANIVVLTAILDAPVKHYVAPPWLRTNATGKLSWRVAAIDADGQILGTTAWRELEVK